MAGRGADLIILCMERYKLDGTKLIYHTEALARFRRGEVVYPILVEISPVSVCNHACQFCYYHDIHAKREFLEIERMKTIISELKELGTKALFFSGEGEPLLHKQAPDMIEHAGRLGFSIAVNTNATPLKGQVMERVLPHLEWIRISLNGVNAQDYARVHRTKEADFERVIENIAAAVAFKRAGGLKVAIGIQCIYTGQKVDDLVALCKRVRDLGVDYFTVKQFNPHERSPLAEAPLDIPPPQAFSAVSDCATDDFQVTLRFGIVETDWHRPYKTCQALTFMTEIMANGKVYSCGPHLGEEDFCYGSIYDMDFKTLWSHENRAKVEGHVRAIENLDHVCMPHCRPDQMNRLLWELENPPPHVNFV